MHNVPFDKFLDKISGQKEILTLEEFQGSLELFISKLTQKYEASKAAEVALHQKYDEKLSKLDFSGSKRAVEEEKNQLTKTLDLDVQLEFLKSIQLLSQRIPEKNLSKPKQMKEFSQIANQILDSKKINTESGRRILLKRFKKYVPQADDILLIGTNSDEDIDQILEEIKNDKKPVHSIDNEVDKIIEEVRRKKDFN